MKTLSVGTHLYNSLIKAVFYLAIGIGHFVFRAYLPSLFLAGMICMGSLTVSFFCFMRYVNGRK